MMKGKVSIYSYIYICCYDANVATYNSWLDDDLVLVVLREVGNLSDLITNIANR